MCITASHEYVLILLQCMFDCFQTEDVELIENELALAREQIEQARRFQEECKELRQQPPSMIQNRSTCVSNLTCF